MSNVMISKSDFTITVKKTGGRITSTGPMTVKNQIEEIRSLDDIPGVNTALKTDGATIVYNATTGQYDVKSYNEDPYLEVVDLYVERLHANNSLGTNGQVLFTNGNTAYWANGVTKITAGTGLTGGGTGENVLLSVNAAYIATITANNATYAYGKLERDLIVNYSTFAGNSTFAFVANDTVFAYGKREADLYVNFATFSGISNFAFAANDAVFAYGKTENILNVNSAVYATLLNGQSSLYYTNATNIIAGTLASERLPNTSVVTGTYGNSSSIPVVTVDQYGRINAISTSAIAGVSSFIYNSGNNTFSISTGDGSVYRASINTVSDFTVTGNLTVSGTTTTVNTENLIVKDAVIRLNDGQDTPLNDIGILMQRYAVANSTNYNIAIAWDESAREFKFGKTPEDGNDNDISFSEEWIRIGEFGNLYIEQNAEVTNNLRLGGQLTVNNVIITELLYPGTANNATYAYGKTENVLNVNSAVYAVNSQFAYSANNSAYAYGKNENTLNVNSAVFSTNAIFAYTANDSVHAYGKTENVLNVNSSVYSTNALYSNNALHLNNKPEEYFTNATNIITGVLAEPHLPFRMDQNVRKVDNVEFHDIVITGNVSITGNSTVINSNNISTTDNMFYLNANNFNANPDIGFVANYNDGTYHHTGFFRDATDGIWKVFDNYKPEPDASIYIDTANVTFHIADFQANTVYFKNINIGNSSVFTTISDGLFTGTANNATYAYGKTEDTLNVNSAIYANSTTYAYGKTEDTLNVNSAVYSTNATFAYVANNTTYAYGKTENTLNVNSAVYAVNANFAYTSNNANYLLGYTWDSPSSIGSATANSGSFTTLSSTDGSKIVIQGGVNGTSTRGIFLWTLLDTKWGIYMAQAGASRSLADDPATPGLDGSTDLAVRNRGSSIEAGWIWENENDVALMQLTPSSGNLLVRGTVNAASYLFGTSGVSINSTFYTATANNSLFLNGFNDTYFTNATNISTGTLASTRLPNTSVVIGTYGNSSSIPVITVDQYGRLTNVSTSAVAGVTDYSYSSSNNTFSIATGDGSAFKATINTVNDFTVTGNLTVSGTTTTVNTQNLTVKDAVIRFNDGQLTPFNDIGILMQRYAVANSTNYNVAFAWDEGSREFKFGKTPEDGSDNDISFSQEWLRVDENGNVIVLQNIESGNTVKVTTALVINNVTITETSYPGNANTATYFNGIIDEGTF